MTNTGFRTLSVTGDIVDTIHRDKEIDLWDKRIAVYPNLYLELVDLTNEQHTALAKVTKTGTVRKLGQSKAYDLRPRNKEQHFALDALMDPNIPIVGLTGRAGTGKTIVCLAASLQQKQDGLYKKILLTRPMSEVGRYKLGALPGDVSEKFGPYLANYTTNLEHFVGENVRDLIEQTGITIVPIQLVRGASFKDTFVIADEMQVCDHGEILTVGTRVAEGSKIVIMGDLNQRDEKIARDKTGIYKLFNDPMAKQSPLVATIELQKCERSETAKFFADLFEGV